MKRVALALPTLSPLGGGVTEAARLHVTTLSQSGLEDISVHTLDRSMDKVDLAQWSRAKVFLNRAYGPKSYSFAPGMLITLLRARPDIVHVHGVWQFQCLAVWLWSKLTGKPYVVTPHGMLEPWIRARSPGLKKIVSRLYQDRFLRGAAAFHILTEMEQGDISEYETGQPVAIIRNFVEPFGGDGNPPAWWRPEFSAKRIFLFLGRIHEKKGCLELCDAWDRLSRSDPDFRDNALLVFCGWNDGLAGFEDRVEALAKTHGNALFAGPQYGAEKNRSLQSAKFFLLPSKSEGLPMAVLEAWAAGIPSIMTPECNLPTGFEKGAAFLTGFTAETILPSLRAAMALGEAEWQTASANALDHVKTEFSADRVRASLLELYRSAIAWKAGNK